MPGCERNLRPDSPILGHSSQGERRAVLHIHRDDGAGHYVKMVHNGIEYGDMQLICEAYFLLKNILGMTAQELHEVFAEWNKGELDSYLIEITSDIFTKTDPETGRPMVEVILDKAGQKGTGNGPARAPLDLGIAADHNGSGFARCISAIKR